jgi:hypothetical protein
LEWEKDTGHIEIHGVTRPLLRAVLNYMYVGEITFNKKEVSPIEVLKFAHAFGMEELKVDCGHELSKDNTAENLKERMALANEYDAEILRIRCKNYFQECFN